MESFLGLKSQKTNCLFFSPEKKIPPSVAFRHIFIKILRNLKNGVFEKNNFLLQRNLAILWQTQVHTMSGFLKMKYKKKHFSILRHIGVQTSVRCSMSQNLKILKFANFEQKITFFSDRLWLRNRLRNGLQSDSGLTKKTDIKIFSGLQVRGLRK